jgi:hypothetical protein
MNQDHISAQWIFSSSKGKTMCMATPSHTPMLQAWRRQSILLMTIMARHGTLSLKLLLIGRGWGKGCASVLLEMHCVPGYVDIAICQWIKEINYMGWFSYTYCTSLVTLQVTVQCPPSTWQSTRAWRPWRMSPTWPFPYLWYLLLINLPQCTV